jgi:ATP-dependent Lon protease
MKNFEFGWLNFEGPPDEAAGGGSSPEKPPAVEEDAARAEAAPPASEAPNAASATPDAPASKTPPSMERPPGDPPRANAEEIKKTKSKNRSSKGVRITPSAPLMQAIQVPEVLPLLPVREAVAFPGSVMPLTVGRARSRRLLDEALTADKIIGVITQRNESMDDPAAGDLYGVGTASLILKMVRGQDAILAAVGSDGAGSGGHVNILTHGLVRFRVVEVVGTEPYLRAKVEILQDPAPPMSPEFDLLMKSVRQAAERMIQLSPNVPDEAVGIINNIDQPGMLADFLAANLSGDAKEKQSLLEEQDITKRLERVREKLASRIEILELQEKIQDQVRSSIDKSQRTFFLQEQMKAIQKELGLEGPEAEIIELKKRLDEAKLPEVVKKETDRELGRLQAIPQASPEYGVIRTFLETVAELPWSVYTNDDLDIKRARQILDHDHYDLEKIKQRIIEFLAVRRLNPNGRGPILCFVGPPGVGKTSLGKSIAASLGRKFVRVSLGGVRDEADIRGHRRTYVGALPGRIIQELRKAGSRNPVMMLDEIDKLGADFRGDPSAALLEVLDPEQNNTFTDHYLGVPFDLSRVIFICTANIMDPVPPALKDRMEVIEIPGYTQADKLLIAKRYLLPKQLKEHGVTAKQIKVPTATVEAIIDQYTREAGVRNLDRTLAAVVRGTAATIAEKMVEAGKLPAANGAPKPTNGQGVVPVAEAPAVGEPAGDQKSEARDGSGNGACIVIQPADLPRLLGPVRFESELAQRTATPGVVTGLAYTPVGGEILFIEATQMPGKGNLQLTGQIGEVMKESAQAAYSLLKHNAGKLGIDPEIFGKTDVHVHVPQGAIPKDGPSAGVAMYTALVSLFLNKPVRPDLAMTGEITLRGLVLPIGGVKEKAIAAHRAGIKKVILPQRNEKNLTEIRDDVKKRLHFHFANTVDEVLTLAFTAAREPGRDGKRAPGKQKAQ